jgi:hypothetical protein
LPKAETTWRALLKDGDLMAESNNLSLLGGTGPKRGGDHSQKGDEKWTHRGNDDDLTNGAKTRIFNPDGVFGIHRVADLPEGKETFDEFMGFWNAVGDAFRRGDSTKALRVSTNFFSEGHATYDSLPRPARGTTDVQWEQWEQPWLS